jgi:tight adherence protein B
MTIESVTWCVVLATSTVLVATAPPDVRHAAAWLDPAGRVTGLLPLVRSVLVPGLAGGRRLARRRRVAVIELCDALSAELQAGAPVRPALELACRGDPDWTLVATTARSGGDVVRALRLCAERPGAEGLRVVAAAWEVTARSGGALSDVLDRVGAGLRDEQEARAEVSSHLAPARATAKLLAALPIFGLALGTSMGAHPLGVLLGSGLGLGCLAVGLGLAGLGVVWVDRLARAVEA